MRVIFAGSPEFACAALRRLCNAGVQVPLVLTQPDRPAGRGMNLHESPVKAYARQRGLALAQPRSLRPDGRHPQDVQLARVAIALARADAMVVAAYGLILPRWLLDAVQPQPSGAGAGAPWGCINIHASLLPRWRGAAPIQRAIEAGDSVTGVSIMQMDEGLDTGDILLSQELSIQHGGAEADTTGSLQARLADLGAEMLLQVLELAAQGRLHPRAQPEEGVCYAHKVDKPQALIDWGSSADLIARRVRAFNPAPGAWTKLGEHVLKVWRAQVHSTVAQPDVAPGTILGAHPGGVDVACGQGVLCLGELQRAGGKRLLVAEFLRGFEMHAGMRFGSVAASA